MSISSFFNLSQKDTRLQSSWWACQVADNRDELGHQRLVGAMLGRRRQEALGGRDVLWPCPLPLILKPHHATMTHSILCNEALHKALSALTQPYGGKLILFLCGKRAIFIQTNKHVCMCQTQTFIQTNIQTYLYKICIRPAPPPHGRCRPKGRR